MGVPASAIRRLLGRAAKTALSEGMAAKATPTSAKILKQALLRQAALAPKTERGYTQLNRLRAFLEAKDSKALLGAAENMSDRKKIGPLLDDSDVLMGLLKRTGQTERSVDRAWRKLMSGE